MYTKLFRIILVVIISINILGDSTYFVKAKISPETINFSQTSSLSGKKVTLDPGHGWAGDPGATANGMFEKDITLDIALKVKTLLERQGVVVTMTRDKDEPNKPLGEASKRANQYAADLVVSIHADASNPAGATGTESCYTVNKSTSGDSLRLARFLSNSVSSQLALTNRGDFPENDQLRCARTNETHWTQLYIHDMNPVTALIETAFINGAAQDVDILKNRRQEIAQGIANGIANFLGGTYYLPFEWGKSVYVQRAGADHALAIDFAVPVGTPIYSSRGGIIQQIVEKNTQYKCDPSYAKYNNQVVIYDSATGEKQFYLHLSTNSVPDNLRVGQYIPAGTLIGKSGQIGYTCGAHLHFQVTKNGARINPQFWEVNGRSLLSKKTYKSLNPHLPFPAYSVNTSQIYAIQALHSSKVLDVKNWSPKDSTPIIQYTLHSGTNQQWRFAALTGNDHGYYQIRSILSGKCLDISGVSLDNGAKLIQYTCNTSSNNQKWRLYNAPVGIVIQAKHSGKVMDVSGASMNNGAPVQQWDFVGTNQKNQLWKLVVITPNSSTLTPTWTKTYTKTPTKTVTKIISPTITFTPTTTPTGTVTNTPTLTLPPVVLTNTQTLTPVITNTETPTSVIETSTVTATRSPTVTLTPTLTRTKTLTKTPTKTPTMTPTSVPDVLIMPRNYTFNWSTSGANIASQNTVNCSSNPDYTRVLYWRTTDTGGWVNWIPNFQIAGFYTIYVYIPDYTHTSPVTAKATYYLNETVWIGTVDQNQNKCGWVSLGRYYFDQGTISYVHMTVQTSESPFHLIAADGMKFVWTP